MDREHISRRVIIRRYVIDDGWNVPQEIIDDVELIKIYGVTELEAINILNGYHLEDYADKYYKIKHLIPDRFSAQRICDGVLAEYGYPNDLTIAL